MTDASLREAHRRWLSSPVPEHYERYRRERRHMGLPAPPSPDPLAAEAFLRAWPRYKSGKKKGQFKPASKLTYKQAWDLIRAYYAQAGWQEKHYAGDLPSWTETHYLAPGGTALLPIGFPPERDPDWNPIQFGALISPDFSTWLGSVGQRTAAFREWRPTDYQPSFSQWHLAQQRWELDPHSRVWSIDKKALAERLLNAALRVEDPYHPNPAQGPEWPWLPLKEVKRWEPLATRRGVSKVARSPRGFLTAYKEKRLDPWWVNRRQGFINRHKAQLDQGERLWEKDGTPTRRHLALIMWAYSPALRKLKKKKAPRAKRNPLSPKDRAAVPYVSPRERPLSPDETHVREVSIALKAGDPRAVVEAAYAMAPLIPPGSSLVPVPGHLPGPPATGTVALAQALASLVGGAAAPILERAYVVPSSRERRRGGLRGLAPEEHAASMAQVARVPPGPVVLVDNVMVSGATFEGARRALGLDAPGVAYAQGADVILRPVRKNTDLRLRELEREWQITNSPSAGERYATALRRVGRDDEADAVEVKIAEVEYRATPTKEKFIAWADALDELHEEPAGGAYWGRHSFPGRMEGNSAVAIAWFDYVSGSGAGEAEAEEEAFAPYGGWAGLFTVGPADAEGMLDTYGPEGNPALPLPQGTLPHLEKGLPVDWFRILRAHPYAIVQTDDWGTYISFYETADSAGEDWRAVQNDLDPLGAEEEDPYFFG